MMQQRKSKKIVIYFFLLILFGSINNIALNESKLKKIQKINIFGLNKEENEALLTEIKNLNFENIFFIDAKKIDNIFSANSLIQSYKIFKYYPSTLNIEIKKTQFLARINKNGKTYIVGSNGKFSKNNYLIKNLPFIFGNPKINEFLNLKKSIDKSKISYDEVKNLFFFQSNRWDVELDNNIIIKLSKDNVIQSINYAYDFLKNNTFIENKIIDVRVKDQIIING